MTEAPELDGRPPLLETADGWLERVEAVTPGMCGQNSLFMGQLGDWTWDAVGATCGIDTYSAVNARGEPAYLSFAYFRVVARTGLCAESIGFGDRLRVRSKVFGCGGSSLLTLHRVESDRDEPLSPGGAAEFFRYDAGDCIHVENFNRWIARSQHDTNHGLRRANPVGFDSHGLDRIPDQYNPRRPYTRVRSRGSFRGRGDPPPQVSLDLTYPVEASRDLNGAGLLYFASYFSIVDWAVLRLWRQLGRSDRRFLARSVLDRQLCFLGNADAEDVLDVKVSTYADRDGCDVFDAALHDRASGALIAVCRQRIRDAGEDPSATEGQLPG